MPLYTFLHNLLNVPVQAANTMGLQKKTHWVVTYVIQITRLSLRVCLNPFFGSQHGGSMRLDLYETRLHHTSFCSDVCNAISSHVNYFAPCGYHQTASELGQNCHYQAWTFIKLKLMPNFLRYYKWGLVVSNMQLILTTSVLGEAIKTCAT
jgi:hypothetical protein